ncbi:soluble lytic murein transglycosylase-like protein [Bradyrhizobium sp. YR681]|uniref:transglycosylase SLT domain-containing protein n=1 Tax=Bradyrhizobium sp. YR681 TaxID=1144344 RepID=UPI00027114BD|nr:transglycosylase SLT domain-containing protein [Bradyrhizobium sp. YR681]EJN11232.1 soluble lytic murein transglycosylase-like protein [Bradyrhizobium sp. YR681]
MPRDKAHLHLFATWGRVGAVLLSLAATSGHASDDISQDVSTTSAIGGKAGEFGAGETPTSRAAVRAIIEKETKGTNLPADIAEAVVFVESGYNPAVIGSVGEVGLMQVRLETARMLGFRGSDAELAVPETNIHYGVLYLSRAWTLAGSDLCRALMKYRAGHGEETMTPRSHVYCNRARNRLLAMGLSPTPAQAAAPSTPEAAPAPVAPTASAKSARLAKTPAQPKAVYARYHQGTAAASRAYWAAHEAKIGLIKARIEAKWKRVASR